MKDTYHIINSHFFFLRKRLTAESSAVGANIGIVSKIIFSSIAIEVSVLIFQEDQIWQMLISSVEKASLVTIGLLVVNSLWRNRLNREKKLNLFIVCYNR